MSPKPVRLAKVEEKNYSYSYFFSSKKIMDMVEAWVLNHATLCLFVAMAFLIACFTVLIFAICGISTMESGAQYNHIQDVI